MLHIIQNFKALIEKVLLEKNGSKLMISFFVYYDFIFSVFRFIVISWYSNGKPSRRSSGTNIFLYFHVLSRYESKCTITEVMTKILFNDDVEFVA